MITGIRTVFGNGLPCPKRVDGKPAEDYNSICQRFFGGFYMLAVDVKVKIAN